MNRSSAAAVPLSPRRRRALTAGVMTGMFLAALEATVVGTAMPTVVASLGGLAQFSWVFSAYLLTSTVTVPLWGKLSDLYGRRRFYELGTALFLLGSALSGLSLSMGQLIGARALQGLGAGALVPLGMTIIGDIYTLEERGRVQGLFSGVWGLSSIIGPVVGGLITDQWSWRWVFFINIPFGIISAVIIWIALEEPKRTTRPSIDYLGAALLTASATLLMLVFTQGGSAAAFAHPGNLALLVLTAGLLAWFIFVERRAREPVVPLGLLRNRIVAVGIIVGFLGGVAMFGVISFVPLFAQGAMGATPTAAGSLLTPLMLSWVIASIIGGRLLIRVGYRTLVILGLIMMSVGFILLSTAGRATTRSLLVTELVMIGCGLGFTMLTLLIAMQHGVPREQLGISTSLNQFFRSIGGAVGVALMGALLTVGMAVNLRRAVGPATGLTASQAARLAADPNALISPAARGLLSPPVIETLQEALAASLRNVFRLCAVVSMLALGAGFYLPRGTPLEPARRLIDQEGERLVMAELTTIDPEHEPVARLPKA